MGFGQSTSLQRRPVQVRALQGVLLGGTIVGILDLAYAILVYSPKRPILIPQVIASGVLGERSFSGGAASATLGVVLHFFIALTASAFYYVASRSLKLLLQHAVIAGLVMVRWSISSCSRLSCRCPRFHTGTCR